MQVVTDFTIDRGLTGLLHRRSHDKLSRRLCGDSARRSVTVALVCRCCVVVCLGVPISGGMGQALAVAANRSMETSEGEQVRYVGETYRCDRNTP